jgi:glycosyltransferase involved in cell wall biosynthesis
MRIAVDARPLATPLTGIGRYTQALLQHLMATDHQWFLYSDRPLPVQLAEDPRVTVRTGSAGDRGPGSLWRAQWSFSRWARQDAVDLFWSPRHHLPLLLSRRIARVVTIHDLVWRRFPATMQAKNLLLERALMGPSIAAADRVICVSRFTADEVCSFYPSAAGKCKVIHEAAVQTMGVGSLPAGVPASYLLFVGTLEPRKNLPGLLRAYAGLKNDPSIPPLVIAGGGGWGQEDLPGIIQGLGLQERVVLCGYVSDGELQALYRGARALLMPSLYEGFGLPVLEAMQHGVPVIASSTSSLPEVAGDGALLVNPLQEAEISGAIRQLVKDETLHAQLSARARQQAGSFCWQGAAGETIELFKQALADRKPQT